jgi:Phospholipase_D-nuclease N-terminal/Short C-terminal domain
MLLAADYPFMNVFWTMVLLFAWLIFFAMVFTVLGDIFRRHDIGGWSKAAWCVGIILVPFLGVLIYLIGNSQGMAERKGKEMQAQQDQFAKHVQDVAGGSATEISRAKELLDSGAINQAEFESLKQKALAPA